MNNITKLNWLIERLEYAKKDNEKMESQLEKLKQSNNELRKKISLLEKLAKNVEN